MGLFSDIYNTVAKFFRPQEEQLEGEASKSVATNRLKLVLMQDRTNLTPKVLEQMRGELIDLLSKYVEMDKELLELNFEQEGDQVALMLSIPVIRAKDEEEIEAALKQESEEESETEAECSEEVSESEEESEDSEESSVDEQDETHAETDSESEDKMQKVSAPKKERKSKSSEALEEDKEECTAEG